MCQCHRLTATLRYTLYASRYDAAQEEFKELMKENAAFAAYMTKWREDQGGRTLSDFLIQPVQRIPRYNLLLSDLLKRTESTHPDYANLQQALANMQSVASYGFCFSLFLIFILCAPPY